MADYPKRFYRRTKKGRELKFPERMLEFCRWCGTCYVSYQDNKNHIAGLCCKACYTLYVTMGIYRKRGR